MKIKLLAICLLLASGASAGVPGYQGLRFSILYDAGVMHPTLVGRTGLIPMLYHNGTLDYVVARDLSIGVTYGFMFYNAQPDRQNYPAYSNPSPANFKGKYTQHTAALQIKKFYRRKGYLAPVGRYITAGVYYQHVVDHSAYISSEYNGGTTSFVPKGFKGIADFGGVLFGVGRTYVVADRMLIDFGCKLSLTAYLSNPLNDSGPDNNKLTVNRDLLLRNLFQIYLGIGALAF